MSVLMATESQGVRMLAGRQIQPQEPFRARIAQEWRRSERSGRPALLVLIDGLKGSWKAQEDFLDIACSTFRETDIFGWFRDDVTFGVIFLELGNAGILEARNAILKKVRERLLSAAIPFTRGASATAHVLPPYSGDTADHESAAEIVEMLGQVQPDGGWFTTAIKRMADICGALILLTALSPFFLVISACVRLTSPGPALFRQTRTGLGGRPFVLYKFRTMKVNSDDKVHQDYVKQFIAGKAEKNSNGNGQQVYKLTGDSRVTRIGRFLRRTSLDELPQLWNVLRGDMSLVGPRPSLPYEVERFELWHRRRVYQLKPGLTGLWQVQNRCRCSFDEMIRMDLRHGQPHSLALYFKVLLQTPGAVIHGSGAE